MKGAEMQEVQNYITRLETQLAQQEQQNVQQSKGISGAMFDDERTENLIRWQLDIKEELERIEHLLKGDVLRYDKKGNEYWDKDKNPLFNEKGIREILKILNWYLNKNILLSNFDEEEIMVRMKQFSRVLINFIFNNYEDLGLDTKEKQKHYPLITLNIINTVEAAYHRALGGGERESLRTARTVTQTEPIGQQLGLPTAQKSATSKLNPFNWFK